MLGFVISSHIVIKTTETSLSQVLSLRTKKYTPAWRQSFFISVFQHQDRQLFVVKYPME